MEPISAYTVCIFQRNKPSAFTWCERYEFDPSAHTLTLYGSKGQVCGTINMDDADFVRVEIYDARIPTSPRVEMFVPRVR